MARVAMKVGHRRGAAEEVATDSTNTLFTEQKNVHLSQHMNQILSINQA